MAFPTFRKYRKKITIDKAILQCFGKTCYAIVSKKLIDMHHKDVPIQFKQYTFFSPRSAYTNYSKAKFRDFTDDQDDEFYIAKKELKPITALSKIRKSIVQKDTVYSQYSNTKFQVYNKNCDNVKPSTVSVKIKKNITIPKVTEVEKYKRRQKISEFHKFFNSKSKIASIKSVVNMSKQLPRKSIANRISKLKNSEEYINTIDYRRIHKRHKSLSEIALVPKELQTISQKPIEQKQTIENILKDADKYNIINMEI